MLTIEGDAKISPTIGPDFRAHVTVHQSLTTTDADELTGVLRKGVVFRNRRFDEADSRSSRLMIYGVCRGAKPGACPFGELRAGSEPAEGKGVRGTLVRLRRISTMLVIRHG